MCSASRSCTPRSLSQRPKTTTAARLLHGAVELMLNNAYEDNIRPPAPDLARIAAHADTVLYINCPDPDANCPDPDAAYE